MKREKIKLKYLFLKIYIIQLLKIKTLKVK